MDSLELFQYVFFIYKYAKISQRIHQLSIIKKIKESQRKKHVKAIRLFLNTKSKKKDDIFVKNTKMFLKRTSKSLLSIVKIIKNVE